MTDDSEDKSSGQRGEVRSNWVIRWCLRIANIVFGYGETDTLRADYNLNFCLQLRSEFASFNELESADVDAYRQFRYRIDNLEAELKYRTYTASDENQAILARLFEVEMLLLRAMPTKAVRFKLWSIRSTYRNLVGEEIYAQYLASNPPDARRGDDDAVRRDLTDLTKGKHWWYLNAIVMEHGMRQHRQTLVRWITGGLVFTLILNLGLAIHAATVYGNAKHAVYGRAISVILLSVYAGILGASVSIARRVKGATDVPLSDTDPVIRLSAIINGDTGIQLSMIMGGAFALILYFLFVAGIAEKVLAKDVLPHFQQACFESESCDGLIQNFRNLIPDTTNDMGRLLVWCFIAGFAEKFVPDILDKLAHGTKDDKRIASTGAPSQRIRPAKKKRRQTSRKTARPAADQVPADRDPSP